jgi:beta-lactamase regulating signal transducer with metallopeptidase domain
LLRKAALASGLARSPQFSESNELSGPVATGLFHPRVIVPKGLLEDIRPEDLNSLLLHELAHLARRDQVELILQHVVAIIFWFHPFVHILNRRLTRSREEICDNHALSMTDGPSFGRALLRIAELAPCRNPGRLSLPLMTSNWSLESRISGILDERRNTMTRCSVRDIALISFCAVSFWSWHRRSLFDLPWRPVHVFLLNTSRKNKKEMQTLAKLHSWRKPKYFLNRVC